MKRTLLLAGVIAATITANSQVQRMVLSEGFSNASCPPCASQNPAYNTLISANPNKIISIKHQTNWPGVDPMNAQTQSDVGPRVTYYGISGVPHGVIDGTSIADDCGAYVGALSCLSQADIDARYAITSPFNITVIPALTANLDSVTVDVTVSTPAIFNGTNLKLQVILVEKLIAFATPPGTTNETQFHNVLRKDMNNANMAGFTIPNSWAAAESYTYTFTIAIPSFIYKHSELAVIAFVQDNTSKEVHQAGKANVPVTSFGITQNIATAPLNCTSTVSGSTTQLYNTGTVTITTATVNYSVDGGATLTVPYAGSLAVGGTTNVTIPDLTGLSNGAHVLETWITNINGSGATSSMGLASKSFNILTGAATATPLTQNFGIAAFPYANWTLDNPNPSLSWARVTTNTGSMKFNNYVYASGTISNFIVEPVDMTTLTTPALTFDVAYCQYSTENDMLEVYVSTNCGSTWTSVYNKTGATLSTKAAQTALFTPTAAQWRNETVDLTAYASATTLFIKYKATSDYGNNLYVDNINIAGSTAGMEENITNGFNVYPNPTKDFVNITFTNAENVTVSLINAVGQTVKVFNNVNTNAQLSLEGLASGVYILNADINGQRVTKQIIKN